MEEKISSPSNGVKEPTRSIYPVLELPPAIEFVTKIYNDLGYSHYHDKETIAKIHGTGYHSIKQKLSTSQQYGLLDLKYNTGYKVTPLFLKLYRPENDSEKLEGIIEALRNPPLYAKLIAEYNNHNVPSTMGLSTTLFRRYGLHESASTKAAQVFLGNLNFYKLIGSDNVLCFDEIMVSNENEVDSVVVSEQPVKENQTIMKSLPPSTNAELMTTDYLEIPIPLKVGKAYLRVPENATEEDFQKIARVVEAYK
jgi:hypothetical protein